MDRVSPPPPHVPTFAEMLPVFAKIGLLSFGGPAGQIALMHRMLVEERGWIAEDRFLHALNFCMLLPGPEAMQLATYIGWRLQRTPGGLAAGLLFVVPGSLVVLALSAAYTAYGQLPLIATLFAGVKAAVLVIVVLALLKMASRALRRGSDWLIAAAAFIGIFFFAVPFPLIVAAAALAGFALAQRSAMPSEAHIAAAEPIPLADTLRVTATWLAVWAAPLVLAAAIFGHSHVTTELSLFFSKLAVVTFGGAYSVLAYMAQQAVETYHWLSPGEMLDGLGLAETTPGPLILVSEFVGYVAAHRYGGEPAVMFGLLGAALTLWATFAPCFLWIFVCAPYVERLSTSSRLAAALAGVTAAVVGVILNLSLWFGLHVLFAHVEAIHSGPLRIWQPELASLDPKEAALALFAAILLLLFRASITATLALTASAALAISLVAGQL